MTARLRVPLFAGLAVLLASLSLTSVLQGAGWLGAGLLAVIVTGGAGLVTRLPGRVFGLAATAAVLIAVVPLLAWPAWPALAAGLVLVILTAAGAATAGRLRGVAVALAYLAALLIYLNLWFAGGPSYAHLIPSHASLTQLGQLVAQAFNEFRYAPPVADTRGVSLVAAGGIGLIAIAVDIVAVRLRQAATAGLPLLVLFSVPVASVFKDFGAVQALTFAAGMGGYLMLLSTAGRDRLRQWGRLVTFRYVQPADEAGTAPDTRELAASGRRVGLAAVCLAVIIPLALPSLHKHDLFGSGSGGGGTGAGSGTSPGLDAMLQVQRALQENKPSPVFSYTTSARNPGNQYFQVYVLNYSSRLNTWQPQLDSKQAPAPDGGQLPYRPDGQLASTPSARVTTSVTMAGAGGSDGQASFLPVPYAPVSVTTPSAGWNELSGSLMLVNPGASLAGEHYTVTSNEAAPAQQAITDAGTMPAGVSMQYGGYSGPDKDALLSIMSKHVQGATNTLQEALQLQNWLLSGSFRYTLKPNLPSSRHWLLQFLTTERAGYCQQYAWAFAVLARLAGIPSRIAVGYTAGTPGPGRTWRVTTADAHAWPELYFPGSGWLRFEPTPHGPGGQDTATVPAYARGSGASSPAGPGAGSTAATGAPGSPAQKPGQLPGQNRIQSGIPGGPGLVNPVAGAGTWPAVVIPLLVVLALLAPLLTRRLTRRRRWLAAAGDAGAARAAWRELTDDLADLGISRHPGETPRALARRLIRDAGLDEAAAQSLGRIVTVAERAAYARLAPPSAGLTADVSRVRRALARTVPVSRRVRAVLLPASTLAVVQHGLQQAGDKLTWLDSSWPAMRRQAAAPGWGVRRQES